MDAAAKESPLANLSPVEILRSFNQEVVRRDLVLDLPKKHAVRLPTYIEGRHIQLVEPKSGAALREHRGEANEWIHLNHGPFMLPPQLPPTDNQKLLRRMNERSRMSFKEWTKRQPKDRHESDYAPFDHQLRPPDPQRTPEAALESSRGEKGERKEIVRQATEARSGTLQILGKVESAMTGGRIRSNSKAATPKFYARRNTQTEAVAGEQKPPDAQ
jgi:hypothetical protein